MAHSEAEQASFEPLHISKRVGQNSFSLKQLLRFTVRRQEKKQKGPGQFTDKNILSVDMSIISEQRGFCAGTVLPGSRLDWHWEEEFLMVISACSNEYLKNLYGRLHYCWNLCFYWSLHHLSPCYFYCLLSHILKWINIVLPYHEILNERI